MQVSKLCLILAYFFFSAVSVQATVRMVPSQYARIQQAVDAASDGDTVLLAPKTYFSEGDLDVMIVNKGLTIMGAGVPSQVVLDGSGEFYHRGFLVIDAPSPTRFRDLSIRLTRAPDLDSTSHWSPGGGIAVENSDVSITNCIFFGCVADHAGGGVYAVDSKLRVENCDFEACRVMVPGGGGIYCGECSVCDISNSRFTDNSASWFGGAILAAGSNLTVRDCDFSGCSAVENPTGEGYGGAIMMEQGTASISRCYFLQNFSIRQGGAIANWGCNLRIDSSLFAENYTICFSVSDSALDKGGALCVTRGSCIVNSCTFVGNHTGCGGAAVEIWGDTAEVNQSIIASSVGSSAYTGNATFTCSDIFGNELGDWTGMIASQLGQNGNVSADPQFCLAFPGDYRVELGSPCDPAVNGCNVLIGSERAGCDVLCGDADFSGSMSISDAVFLIRYIFASGTPPVVLSSGDVSCNGVVNISDVVYLINYIFASGPVPCAACP